MNEQWKRLIEAERRLARLESGLSRANSNVVAVQGQIRNEAHNVTNPFGTGGGGTSGMHRFATRYEVWVEWDMVPTLKTGASSNPTADVTSLANAVSEMEVGYILTQTNVSAFSTAWYYDSISDALFERAQYEFSDANWLSAWPLAKWDGGNFLIDSDVFATGEDFDTFGLSPTSGDRFNLSVSWNRRNGVGTIIGTDTLIAVRTSISTDEFAYGPTYGDSGVWSFAMTCAATTRHNAGSGTIFLRWGAGESFAYSGGSPDDLPADAFDGGSPDDLPADIIDGGTI